jgi:hypothetical protein
MGCVDKACNACCPSQSLIPGRKRAQRVGSAQHVLWDDGPAFSGVLPGLKHVVKLPNECTAAEVQLAQYCGPRNHRKCVHVDEGGTPTRNHIYQMGARNMSTAYRLQPVL